MSVAWTDRAALQAAVGPTVVLDAYADDAVAAANDWCFRKRAEAGYSDDPLDGAAAPSADVAFGATLRAVALWRERAATDGYPSFEDLGGFAGGTGGSMGTIRQLLGIGRGQSDGSALSPATVAAYRARRARHGRVR